MIEDDDGGDNDDDGGDHRNGDLIQMQLGDKAR